MSKNEKLVLTLLLSVSLMCFYVLVCYSLIKYDERIKSKSNVGWSTESQKETLSNFSIETVNKDKNVNEKTTDRTKVKTNQTKENEKYWEPIYNPLIGMSRGKLAALLSGQDQEHPLYTTDKNGQLQFHPENSVYKKSNVVKVKIDANGNWDVVGRKEQINRNIDSYTNELDAAARETAKSLMKSQDRPRR